MGAQSQLPAHSFCPVMANCSQMLVFLPEQALRQMAPSGRLQPPTSAVVMESHQSHSQLPTSASVMESHQSGSLARSLEDSRERGNHSSCATLPTRAQQMENETLHGHSALENQQHTQCARQASASFRPKRVGKQWCGIAKRPGYQMQNPYPMPLAQQNSERPSARCATRAPARSVDEKQKSKPQLSSEVGGESEEAFANDQKGAISKLQEYVQSSKEYPCPSSLPPLKWDWKEREKQDGSPGKEFCAQVTFPKDGLLHTVLGVWRQKKKFAQRDTAERALAIFECGRGPASTAQLDRLGHWQGCESASKSTPELMEKLLQKICGNKPSIFPACCNDGKCQAVVQIALDGVPHCFQGAPKSDETAAKADALRRVLWYLNHADFSALFHAPPAVTHQRFRGRSFPSPPEGWMSMVDHAGSASMTVAN